MKSSRIINQPIGKDWLVSIEGRRARVIRDHSKPVTAPGFFRPGLLLSIEESVDIIKKVSK